MHSKIKGREKEIHNLSVEKIIIFRAEIFLLKKLIW